ncbi:hypothetical protein BH10PLA2_BH10PLA2_36150 [soil metagenome]
MDTYTKSVLTVMAVALSLIAIRPIFEPSRSPTIGDLISLREIKDADKRQYLAMEMRKRIPLAHIQSGQVDVSGSVEIEK